MDGSGNILIADGASQRVRVVAARGGTFYGQAMTAKDIYTVAGDGTAGYTGDGGAATGAELNAPGGLTVDASGNLVIADAQNNAVRVVAGSTGTFYGQAMTAGDIYTVAGDGTAGFGGDGGPGTSAVGHFGDGGPPATFTPPRATAPAASPATAARPPAPSSAHPRPRSPTRPAMC